MLVAKTQAGKVVFIVDSKTGSLQPADATALPARVAELARAAEEGSLSAVLDKRGKFVYVMDSSRAELHGYSVSRGKLVELAVPYPVSRSTSGIAIVNP
jgi:hypothetical protein